MPHVTRCMHTVPGNQSALLGNGNAGFVRTLGRAVRTGSAEPADEDAFVRIRLAYEGAAERLPDSAWPWYRLAEMLAWAGFAERAQAHLAEAERRNLGSRVLLHVSADLGTLITERFGASIYFDHVSNGGAWGRSNQGLETFGLRGAWWF